ncbi:MAG TPA: hypothetical protein VJ488_02940 [Dehalococcoidia bacterium]|nr:hypothetical protein [Dehalococcoidia bacterium]
MSYNRKIKPSEWEELKLKLRKMLGAEKILCNSCKYDWRSACHRAERPHAVWCPDYQKRG